MNSQIVLGHVMHSRLEPVQHSFVYPVYFFVFDLSELQELNHSLNLFGYNKVRPVAIHDRDYLGDSDGSIYEKLMSLLAKKGCSDDIVTIKLVTVARYFNYVFNPVSFYYCYRADGSLRCAVTEINNTYGEKHLYVLDKQLKSKADLTAKYQLNKDFYVSPFNDLKGDYEFYLSEINAKVDIRINIIKEKREVFQSRLWGKTIPLNSFNLTQTLIKYPLTAALAMPRITKEALFLKYQKGLKTYLKPKPTSPMTFPSKKVALNLDIQRKIAFLKYKVSNLLIKNKNDNI